MSLHLFLNHHTAWPAPMKPRIHRVLLRTTLVLLCLTSAALLRTPSGTAAPPDNPRRTPIVEAVERDRGAVVNIHSERTVKAPAGDDLPSLTPSQNRVNGMGTGIIIDPRGYIITNQHVVEDVSVIRVRLADGASFNARVLARDSETDLALLKIEAGRPLPVMPFGTATDLMVGETVIAIGNAFGYEHTVTTGIVSAVKRDVTLNKDISYKSLIQTCADINPGNSGGPLLNINGDLVGVNVAIRAGAQGIGFAIPVDTMLRVAAEMMSSRRRTSLTHGLACRDRVDTTQGAPIRSLVVERIETGGAAAQAGVQRGDIIVQVGDQRVGCALELERCLLERAAGDRVPVVIRRNGTEQKVELVLLAVEKTVPVPAEVVWRKVGLRFNPVNGEVVSRVNPHLHGGLAVTEVNGDSPAGKAGIQRGDILVGLHQWETITLDNVAFVVTHPDLASFNPLRFYIVRGGQVHRGWLQQVD
ncbi:MAG: trypsin-like peptidase domain-containing protein [Gemmataceae bacterium]|nr:trypsin-like peptidase domain-containing protein [Gemmataceae bacterium]